MPSRYDEFCYVWLKTTTAATNQPTMPFLKRLRAPALLFGLTVLFYWKLVLTDQYTWLESPDLAYQVLPWLQFQAGEWHAGRFPLWDPNGWLGQPLFGQGQPGSAYPLNWLLFPWPLKNGWMEQAALHWYFVLIHFLAVIAAYALCRSLKLSRAAAVIGGLIYGLGGYVGNTDWPQMLNGAVWTPLAFLFLFRAAREERPWASAIVSGFFLGLGWLAGHHQMNLLATLAAAGVWAWLAAQDRRRVKLAAVSMLVALCAGAFQTLPMAEYGARALRWTGSPNDPLGLGQTVPYSVHEKYELKPHELLGIFLPGAAEGPRPYVGFAACGLAFLGLALCWKRNEVRWLGAIALAGILFALGGETMLHGVFYALAPLVDKARVPAAGTLLFSLGVAPLAAFGFDAMREARAAAWPRRVAWAFSVFALVIAGVALAVYLLKAGLDERVLLAAVAAGLAAAWIMGVRSGVLSERLAGAAFAALVLLELSMVTTYSLANRNKDGFESYLKPMAEHGDLIEYLRGQDGDGRVEYQSSAIHYNLGDWYGLDTLNTYVASVLQNVWSMDVFSRRTRDFLGVRYYLGGAKQSPEQIEVFSGRSGIKVFLNPQAFPRAWAVHRISLPSDELNLREEASVSGAAPRLENCAGDQVNVAMHQPNFVRIDAELRCRGLVVLTDAWYPGWKATVDGSAAPILEVDGGVRGVVVERGRHRMEMKYRPRSVMWGAALTLAAAFAAIGAAFARQSNSSGRSTQ